MSGLFFWRRKPAAPAATAAAPAARGAEPAAAPPAAAAPGTPTAPAAVPLSRRALAFVLGDPASDPSRSIGPEQQSVLMAASREFARIGTESRHTPHRPSLLPQLIEVVHDEDASLRALSRILSQDPELTGDLLRTANSALYRVSSTPVESVERACALLGTQGLRTLIAAALVRPLARGGGDSGPFGELIWEHSLYSASAAEAWAARQQDADPFAAHLLALMHGLGAVAVYRVLMDQYAQAPGTAPDAAAIASALETNAAVAAARIAGNWGLSERTRQALEAQSSAAPVGDPQALARALAFGLRAGSATLLCRHKQLGEDLALAELQAGGQDAALIERIWDRLLRAYVRH